jgi:hypothetical protein
LATLDIRSSERRAALVDFFALEDADFRFDAERPLFALRVAFLADLRAPDVLAAPPRLAVPRFDPRFVFLAAMANHLWIRELESGDEVQEAGTAVAMGSCRSERGGIVGTVNERVG